MTTGITEGTPVADPPQTPPTRAEQLRAVATLIKSGGLKPLAVYTYGQQKTAAKNAMYKYLGKSVVAGTAAVHRMLLPVATTPAEGSLRDKLIELVDRQAVIIQTSPLRKVALTWFAAGAPVEVNAEMTKAAMFRMGLNYHYRQPFEELFATEEGRAALGGDNVPAAVAQLVGPVAYGRLVGAARTTHDDHVRIVDEFLASHRAPVAETPDVAESSDLADAAEPIDTVIATAAGDSAGVTEPGDTAAVAEPDDIASTIATNDVAAVGESDDAATAAIESDESVAVAESDDITTTPEASDTTPATESSDVTPVTESSDTITAAESNSTTSAAESTDTAIVAESGDTTTPEATGITPASESTDTVAFAESSDTTAAVESNGTTAVTDDTASATKSTATES